MKDQKYINDIRKSLAAINAESVPYEEMPPEAQAILDQIDTKLEGVFKSLDDLKKRKAEYERQREFYRRSVAAKRGWQKRRAREIAEWRGKYFKAQQ